MARGKLIVLEGGDGSGKTVQTKLLCEALAREHAVTTFDFPRYEESLYGKLVGECLAGKHGDFLTLSPYISSLPFTLDRVSAKASLEAALAEGHVISNRYVPSNISHQAAKLKPEEREQFIAFLERGEYEELGLPRPSLVVYLYVPRDIAGRLVEQKGTRHYLGEEKKDVHEKDFDYQERVAGIFADLAETRAEWVTVSCAPDEKLLCGRHTRNCF